MKLTEENYCVYKGDFCLWFESRMVRKDRQYWLEVHKAWPTEKELRDFANKLIQGKKLLELIEERIEECKTNSNGLNFAEEFKEYAYQERVGKELQALWIVSKK